MIYELSTKPMEHMSFWRGLDSNEATALYTSEKILAMFSGLIDEYNNDDLKRYLQILLIMECGSSLINPTW